MKNFQIYTFVVILITHNCKNDDDESGVKESDSCPLKAEIAYLTAEKKM